MGLPIGFALTGGEASDFKGYDVLLALEGPAAKVLLADKGYDADHIRQDMDARGRFAKIPTKRNRKVQLPVDPEIYALRNFIERCFNKLKNARRLAPYTTRQPEAALPLYPYALSGCGSGSSGLRDGVCQQSLGLIIAEYRASHPFLRLAPRTQQDYLRVLDWLMQLGSLEMATMNAPDIVRIRDKAHKSKKIRFANYVLAVLSVLFGFAIERGFALRNPVKDVKNIRKSSDAPKANRPWTRKELDAFQNAAPKALSLPFVIARWTGLRQGDVLKLTKDAYDGKTIRVLTAKRRIYVAVPVPEDLQKMLNERLKLPGTLLCLNSRGEPWTESGFRASFFKLIRKLAKDGKVGKGLSFHGIRSTVATELREAGVDLRTIADLLGQNTEQMASHYSKDADVSANVQDAAGKLLQTRKLTDMNDG